MLMLMPVQVADSFSVGTVSESVASGAVFLSGSGVCDVNMELMVVLWCSGVNMIVVAVIVLVSENMHAWMLKIKLKVQLLLCQ